MQDLFRPFRAFILVVYFTGGYTPGYGIMPFQGFYSCCLFYRGIHPRLWDHALSGLLFLLSILPGATPPGYGIMPLQGFYSCCLFYRGIHPRLWDHALSGLLFLLFILPGDTPPAMGSCPFRAFRRHRFSMIKMTCFL